MLVTRSFKYRCYPSNHQIDRLNIILENSRLLYNHLLDAEKKLLECGCPVVLGYDLLSYIAYNKENLPYLKDIPSFSRIYVADRLSDALKECLRKTRKLPRFKKKKSYKSVTYPFSILSKKDLILDNKIKIPTVGKVKINFHRNLPKEYKIFTLNLKKDKPNSWYVTIVIQYDKKEHKLDNKTKVGIDVGVEKLLTLSDGTYFENFRFYKKSLERLKVLSRRLSKKKKGSKNRQKARIRLAKLHQKIANQRKDYLHKISRLLVEKYDFIALEDLNISRMCEGKGYKNPYSKSILDSGWGMFNNFLLYKSEETNTIIDSVNPKNTTQTCSKCNHVLENKLQIQHRIFKCEKCGFTTDRDYNASRNILKFSGQHLSDELVEQLTLVNVMKQELNINV